MDIQAIRSLIAADMKAVDELIQNRLYSDVVLINQLSRYIINSGGKRLRPIVALLSARACSYTGNQHINLAAIIELIHTATLLHDDVVDASDLRRGRETANHIWGSEASVLVGDFLYSRSFQMMVTVGNMHVMEILADTTNIIAEGEVMQLLNCNDPDISEERYLATIRNKTAQLFAAACRLGAVIAARDATTEMAMNNYGMYLGTAFQLIDDVLDYSASAEELGKNIGDDLAEGKPTLPLLYAMWHGDPEQVRLIRNAIEHGGRDDIELIVKTIEATGAIEYTAARAREETLSAIKSLENLDASPYKDALRVLAEFAVNRTS